MSLVDDLIAKGVLKTPRIIQAFRDTNRADFLPKDERPLAEGATKAASALRTSG